MAKYIECAGGCGKQIAWSHKFCRPCHRAWKFGKQRDLYRLLIGHYLTIARNARRTAADADSILIDLFEKCGIPEDESFDMFMDFTFHQDGDVEAFIDKMFSKDFDFGA